jgi:beta-mannosidase
MFATILFLVTLLLSIGSFALSTAPLSVVPDTNHVVHLGNNDWRLESSEDRKKVHGHVPGDVLTDLVEAGILEDPYFDRNFLTQERHVVWNKTWIYSTTVELPNDADEDVTWQLVVEGIKMGAELFFNGVFLGTVRDQFLRYTFTLEQHHLGSRGPHVLTISFDPRIQVDGRFTACSGGWDWAPYAKQMDAQGRQMFSLGIVKPIYLVAIRHYVITHVVPKVYYHGPYPREPLVHGSQGDFTIDVDVHLEFAKSSSASSFVPSLVVESSDFGTQILPVTPPTGTNTTIVKVSMVAPKESVQLWWPNGMGEQPLYNIYVRIITNATNTTLRIRKRIGTWKGLPGRRYAY